VAENSSFPEKENPPDSPGGERQTSHRQGPGSVAGASIVATSDADKTYSIVTLEVTPGLTVRELRAAFDADWSVVTRWGRKKRDAFGNMVPEAIEEKRIRVTVMAAHTKANRH
jgi:hypothetical protein